jgi:hypothetical protein
MGYMKEHRKVHSASWRKRENTTMAQAGFEPAGEENDECGEEKASGTADRQPYRLLLGNWANLLVLLRSPTKARCAQLYREVLRRGPQVGFVRAR